MPGHDHGKSIKRPRTYEALRRKGMSKTKAAKISNAQDRRYPKGWKTMSKKSLSTHRRSGTKPSVGWIRKRGRSTSRKGHGRSKTIAGRRRR